MTTPYIPYNRYNLGDFNSGTYSPNIVNISAITKANPALVTTSVNHTFVVGQEVQFFIPQIWGMRQLDGMTGYVLSIPSPNQFTVNISTIFFDTFVTPTPSQYVVIDNAQVSGIGDANSGYMAPGAVQPLYQTVPGAFENQPP